MSYKIFETLQEADKILSKLNKIPQHWYSIKDEVIKNGLQNYLGWLSKNIDDLDYLSTSEIIDVLKWIKSNKINVNNKNILDLMNDEYHEYKQYYPYKKFVNKWCPSSLRDKDTYLKLFNKLNSSTFGLSIVARFELIDEDMKLSLKKGSICKSVDEWIELVNSVFSTSFNLQKLKRDNGMKIHFENEGSLIVEPLRYISYVNNLISPNWCLISKKMYDAYHKDNNNSFLIYIDKNDIKSSLVFTIKKDGKYLCNDYNNRTINIENIDSDIINNINKILK